MKRAAWIVLLISSLASAQPMATAQGPCGGVVTHWWVTQPYGYGPNINIGGTGSIPPGGGNGGNAGNGGSHPATPVGGGGNSGGGNSGGSGGGGDAAVVLLAVVAAAAVALPIVVYVLDEDARPDVMQCWTVPEERVALYGGAVSGSGYGGAPMLGTRGLLNWYFLGLEGGVEGSRYGTFDVYGEVLARIPPKQHLELSLGFGGRRLYNTLGGQSWFEVSLPQRYTPFRWSALEPGISFDLRPSFLFSPYGVWDVRVEGGIVFPLGPYASIGVGGKAYSFQGTVQGGVQLGLDLSL